MYPGVYCTEHIIFLLAAAAAVAAGLVAVSRFADTEKKKTAVIKSSAALLLVWILTNRISVTAGSIAEDPGVYSWVNLLPYTFCGFASLLYSVSALISAKNNPVFHFIALFGFFGGLATLLYPDFLYEQTFWDIRSFSGLLHHALMVWMTLLLAVTGRWKPDLYRWWIYPAGFCAMMTLGIFEIDALGFPSAMNIGEPLIGSLPVLTGWPVIFAVSTAVNVLAGAAVRAAEIKGRAGKPEEHTETGGKTGA
ncbi:MAG: YwaF family protein [Clostridia bacterium]|nr:YwaF family protein [Clostridia bacterium]